MFMRLYIADKSDVGQRMISSFRSLLHRRYGGNCTLEIIDVTEHPERARQDEILATPTLVRLSPTPEFRVVGNLRNKARIMSILDNISHVAPECTEYPSAGATG